MAKTDTIRVSNNISIQYYSSDELPPRIVLIGSVHNTPSVVSMLMDCFHYYEPDCILYEETFQEAGLNPQLSHEHEAIKRYIQQHPNVKHRSMDIPMNTNGVSAVGELVNNDDLVVEATLSSKEITEQDLVSFKSEVQRENSEQYEFIHDLRNDRMAIEIIKEAKNARTDEMIVAVAGNTHLFGHDSIGNKITANLEDPCITI